MAERRKKFNKKFEKKFDKSESLDLWRPKTQLGRRVKDGEITDIKQILDEKLAIKEPEIVDLLLPGLGSDYILIGQQPGKFGGGKRRIIRQTQKKTAEGNKPRYSALAVVGNRNGIFGAGLGKAKDSMPARDKALRNAKLNIQYVARGCGSWRCACDEFHSIPFSVEAGCGSVRVKIQPAPKGTGLVADTEIKKLLSLAGYSDLWFKSNGSTNTKINFITACVKALDKAVKIKTDKRTTGARRTE